MTLPILIGMQWRKIWQINADKVLITDANRTVYVKAEDLGLFDTGKVTNGHDFVIVKDGLQVPCEPIYMGTAKGLIAIPAYFVTGSNSEFATYWGSPNYIINHYNLDWRLWGEYHLSTTPTAPIVSKTQDMGTLDPNWAPGTSSTPWNVNQLVDGTFSPKALQFDGTYVDGFSSKNLVGRVSGMNDNADFTIRRRFYVPNTDGYNCVISSNPATGVDWVFYQTNGVTVANQLTFNGHMTQINDVLLPAGALYDTFITFDSVNRVGKLYINGVCVKTITGIADTSTNPGGFGQWWVGSRIDRKWPSQLKDEQASFYQEVLDPDTIKTLSDNTIDYDNYFTFDATYRVASTAQSKNQSFKNKSFKNITFKR